MALRLLYLIFCQLIGWLALFARGQASTHAEILVLLWGAEILILMLPPRDTRG